MPGAVSSRGNERPTRYPERSLILIFELPRSAVAISADNGTSQIQADALDFLISAERTDLAESARSYGVFRRSRCATILIFLIYGAFLGISGARSESGGAGSGGARTRSSGERE
jgi:hypothetical protein